MINTPRKIISNNNDFNMLQDEYVKIFQEIARLDLLNGFMLKDIMLNVGENKIAHRLNRVPNGYIVIDKNASADIFSVKKDQLYLTLDSDAVVKVSLWVF